MIRRFVNLVLEDYGSRRYSLHRLDVAKYLFYPSTAQAEAANAKKKSDNGGGDKPMAPKPPRIKRMRRLPKPSMNFSPFFPPVDDDEEEPSRWSSCEDDTFILLSPGRSEGRILHATQGDRTVVYDADAHAVIATAPSFPAPMDRCIAFSVPGDDGSFMEQKESLYVMSSTIRPPLPEHNCYDPAPKEQNDGCSGDFVVLNFNEPYNEWQRLPRPPFAHDGVRPGSGSDSDMTIRSSTVVNGGRTICVSVSPSSLNVHGGDDVKSTYCFDTVTRQWRHAGDWALPFHGRAEYVPELGIWIGLSSSPPHHLCASDLAAADGAPTPQHVWDDFTPPPDKSSSIVLNRRYPQYVLHHATAWRPHGLSLVNLGSGRFCILKVFGISRSARVGFHYSDDEDEDEEFAVLTGVEVLRSHDGEGLRMVKHKSRRCCEFNIYQDHWLL